MLADKIWPTVNVPVNLEGVGWGRGQGFGQVSQG